MPRRQIHAYSPELKHKARLLRKHGTKAEAMLWKQIQNRQVCGCRFLRQRPIDEFIVDFYCPEMDLVVEVDGITHENKQDYDRRRQERLEDLGLHVLRFLDDEVKKNIEGVVQYV
ncbi:MAG: endonuclease domain-containing protein [Desulfovermiculus sp.]